MIIYATMLKSSHESFITSSFRVSSATNYRVKKAICTIGAQSPFFLTISSPCHSDIHTHTHPFTDIETNAHKHLTHYAKAPAAGNTFPTGWQEGEERNSGQLGGGGDGGEESWMDGWVERRCWREEGRRKNEKE